jgi:hypothetical protein
MLSEGPTKARERGGGGDDDTGADEDAVDPRDGVAAGDADRSNPEPDSAPERQEPAEDAPERFRADGAAEPGSDAGLKESGLDDATASSLPHSAMSDERSREPQASTPSRISNTERIRRTSPVLQLTIAGSLIAE